MDKRINICHICSYYNNILEDVRLGNKLKEADYKMLILDCLVYHDESLDKRKTLKII